MNVDEIQKQVEIIIREKFRYYVCSISYSRHYEVGTGSLIKHKGQLFILTCHHIATEAYKHENLEICFSNNIVLSKNQISLFRKSKTDDIALFKINESLNFGDLIPLVIEDFIFSNDLRTVSEKYSDFVVVGFPTDIIKVDNAKKLIQFRPLFYITTLAHRKQQRKTKLYLDYPYEKENISELPKAPGLSGAGIWFVPSLTPVERSNSVIWSSTNFRFIAIQHAWKAGEYIVGTRINKLSRWLKQF